MRKFITSSIAIASILTTATIANAGWTMWGAIAQTGRCVIAPQETLDVPNSRPRVLQPETTISLVDGPAHYGRITKHDRAVTRVLLIKAAWAAAAKAVPLRAFSIRINALANGMSL
jgi:hypothetical protein